MFAKRMKNRRRRHLVAPEIEIYPMSDDEAVARDSNEAPGIEGYSNERRSIQGHGNEPPRESERDPCDLSENHCVNLFEDVSNTWKNASMRKMLSMSLSREAYKSISREGQHLHLTNWRLAGTLREDVSEIQKFRAWPKMERTRKGSQNRSRSVPVRKKKSDLYVVSETESDYIHLKEGDHERAMASNEYRVLDRLVERDEEDRDISRSKERSTIARSSELFGERESGVSKSQTPSDCVAACEIPYPESCGSEKADAGSDDNSDRRMNTRSKTVPVGINLSGSRSLSPSRSLARFSLQRSHSLLRLSGQASVDAAKAVLPRKRIKRMVNGQGLSSGRGFLSAERLMGRGDPFADQRNGSEDRRGSKDRPPSTSPYTDSPSNLTTGEMNKALIETIQDAIQATRARLEAVNSGNNDSQVVDFIEEQLQADPHLEKSPSNFTETKRFRYFFIGIFLTDCVFLTYKLDFISETGRRVDWKSGEGVVEYEDPSLYWTMWNGIATMQFERRTLVFYTIELGLLLFFIIEMICKIYVQNESLKRSGRNRKTTWLSSIVTGHNDVRHDSQKTDVDDVITKYLSNIDPSDSIVKAKGAKNNTACSKRIELYTKENAFDFFLIVLTFIDLIVYQLLVAKFQPELYHGYPPCLERTTAQGWCNTGANVNDETYYFAGDLNYVFRMLSLFKLIRIRRLLQQSRRYAGSERYMVFIDGGLVIALSGTFLLLLGFNWLMAILLTADYKRNRMAFLEYEKKTGWRNHVALSTVTRSFAQLMRITFFDLDMYLDLVRSLLEMRHTTAMGFVVMFHFAVMFLGAMNVICSTIIAKAVVYAQEQRDLAATHIFLEQRDKLTPATELYERMVEYGNRLLRPLDSRHFCGSKSIVWNATGSKQHVRRHSKGIDGSKRMRESRNLREESEANLRDVFLVYKGVLFIRRKPFEKLLKELGLFHDELCETFDAMSVVSMETIKRRAMATDSLNEGLPKERNIQSRSSSATKSWRNSISASKMAASLTADTLSRRKSIAASFNTSKRMTSTNVSQILGVSKERGNADSDNVVWRVSDINIRNPIGDLRKSSKDLVKSLNVSRCRKICASKNMARSMNASKNTATSKSMDGAKSVVIRGALRDNASLFRSRAMSKRSSSSRLSRSKSLCVPGDDIAAVLKDEEVFCNIDELFGAIFKLSNANINGPASAKDTYLTNLAAEAMAERIYDCITQCIDAGRLFSKLEFIISKLETDMLDAQAANDKSFMSRGFADRVKAVYPTYDQREWARYKGQKKKEKLALCGSQSMPAFPHTRLPDKVF